MLEESPRSRAVYFGFGVAKVGPAFTNSETLQLPMKSGPVHFASTNPGFHRLSAVVSRYGA